MIFLFSTWDWLEWQSPAQCYLWGRSVSEYFSYSPGQWRMIYILLGEPTEWPPLVVECHHGWLSWPLSPPPGDTTMSQPLRRTVPLSPAALSSLSPPLQTLPVVICQQLFMTSDGTCNPSHLRYNWSTAWLELFTKHLSIWASWRVVSGQLGDTEF